MMHTLIIVIENSSDHYSAYAENCPGVYGAGNTPTAAKENIEEAIDLLKQQSNCPELLKQPFVLEYRYDVESLLRHFHRVFSMPALEKLTGIHQKQLHHYSAGAKKPREAQRKKIEKALHQLGQELLSIKL